jgi:CheY-like chemotaxis protein
MPKKILIVEDHPDIREIFALTIRSMGYEAVEAEDAIAGVKKSQTEQPSMIFMDLCLPGLDGVEATRKIKADSRTASIPVVIYSVMGNESIRDAASEAGVSAYFVKPLRTTVLKDVIERFAGP